MIDGGALTVTLTWRDGRLRAVIDAPPPVSLSRLVQGKPAAEAARLAGLVAESCATAHEVAARTAFGLPARPADARRMAAETLREHALRCLQGWPLALGWTAPPPPNAEDGAEGRGALAAALFGGEGLPDRIETLEIWMRRGETVPARVLDHVWRRWDGRWGRADLPLWRPGERVGGVDLDEAELSGAPFEMSVAARVADTWVMREVEARRGRGVAWRLLARLVDADRLLRGLREEGPLEGARALGPGLGAAEAGGGAIIAEGALRGGRVTGLRILTHSDCALHPAGLLRLMLDTAPNDRAAPVEAVASMILEAADVRAPTRLVIDRAERAGQGRRTGVAAS
jgi:hypothetical protein